MNSTTILQVAASLLGDDLNEVHPEYVRAITDMLCDLVPVSPNVLDKGGHGAAMFMLGMAYQAGA